jgi:hypothetical protein
MTTPGGAGTYPMRKRSFLRARRIGFSHRVGAFSLLGSGPSLCPGPMPQGLPALTFVENGGAACWSPIPLQAPIIPPLSSYQITRPSMKIIHFRYIRWPSSALQLA